jgi:hypothetical protein
MDRQAQHRHEAARRPNVEVASHIPITPPVDQFSRMDPNSLPRGGHKRFLNKNWQYQLNEVPV